jgi:predicted N-acetyltransferase YhbS
MTAESFSIRDANPDEADFLTELALRSKAVWGYPQDFLDSCRPELTVDRNRIDSDDYQCVVAVDRGLILGYYTLELVSEDEYELAALFVEPAYIGTGIGRSLIRHAIQALAEQHAKRMIIQGDPNASQFYIAAGARQVGYRESESIPGRRLPLFAIDLGSG